MSNPPDDAHPAKNAGSPRGANEATAVRHVPMSAVRGSAQDLVLAARVHTSDGKCSPDRLQALRQILSSSGFELQCHSAASPNEDELYVVYEQSRHAEVFLILREQGFKPIQWSFPV